MRILLQTEDGMLSDAYRAAAKERNELLCIAENASAAMERLLRDPFDALIVDGPEKLHPFYSVSPILRPSLLFFLLKHTNASGKLPDFMTFAFSRDKAPEQVLSCVASFPEGYARQYPARWQISDCLLRLGVPVHVRGFCYLTESLRLILREKDPTAVGTIDAIYRQIAARFHVRPSVAEHAIRHAIDAAWLRADPDVLEEVFGYTVSEERGTPSNAAFLFRAADHIRIQRGGTIMTDEEFFAVTDKLYAMYDNNDALLNAAINVTLQALAVPAQLLGYRYLFLAVRYIRTRPAGSHPAISKEIYPYVAKEMETNPAMVERSIRYAIAKGWSRADPDTLYSYIGLRGRNLRYPPTNGEYIYLVAERVRLFIGDPTGEARYQRILREMGYTDTDD
ncbi:MAG: sporulation initiation factor Spo0A C-terminal domain-containing protein [Clostridia bacterium]|nr:sporulation initiation factor Spo0A C-terminal domain-containing protein [Clostridia bacterium]